MPARGRIRRRSSLRSARHTRQRATSRRASPSSQSSSQTRRRRCRFGSTKDGRRRWRRSQLTGAAPERRSGALEAIALAVGSPFAAGADRSGTCAAGALLPRPRISQRARGDDGDRRVAGTGHGAHVRGERGAAPGDQLRRDRGRAVDQVVAGQQGRSADAGRTGRRRRRRGNREAAVRARDLPARRSSARAGSCAWPVQGVLPVKAIVSLEETRRFQLRYGLELSSEYTSALDQRTNALGVAADIRDRNFLGRGMSLGGGLRYEPDLRSARALFSVPTLRRRPIRTNLFLNGRGEEQRDEQLKARRRRDQPDVSSNAGG